MLGEPPLPPDAIWSRALDHALDPWAVPDGYLVPADGVSASAANDLTADDDAAWDTPHDHADDVVVVPHSHDLTPDDVGSHPDPHPDPDPDPLDHTAPGAP